MAIVNFSVPKSFEKRVLQVIKEKGFASKAEFFRFAALYFMDVIEKPFVSEDTKQIYLTKKIEDEIVKKYRGKNIPSLQDQFADL